MISRVPDAIRRTIEDAAAGVPLAALSRASAALTASYHAENAVGHGVRHVTTAHERLAYAITRVPATFAAVSAALHNLVDVAPSLDVRSVTDLGAGTGAATWAAAEAFPDLASASCVERDGGFVDLGRACAAASGIPVLATARWIPADVATVDIPAADLVVAAYALSELERGVADAVLERAWAAARVVLVVVEPGTHAGTASVLADRATLIGSGAWLAGPCPHAEPCPMAPPDWCHFAARLERSSLHRRIKSGEYGHEDEKYAWVAFTKEKVERAPARIVRHPRKPPKVIELELCTANGLTRAHVGKGRGAAWRAARHAAWGDAWRD